METIARLTGFKGRIWWDASKPNPSLLPLVAGQAASRAANWT
jgi:hypothetical protein